MSDTFVSSSSSSSTLSPADIEALERARDKAFFDSLPSSPATLPDLAPPTSYRLPPSDWQRPDEWEFLGFIMHFHTQQCKCGARHSWTQTFRLFGHRYYAASRGHRTTPFTGSTTGMPSNEPLALYTLPDEPILICHSCMDGYRAAGSDIIELRAASDQNRWLNALLEDAAREREARRKAQAPTKAPTKEPTKSATTADLMSI